MPDVLAERLRVYRYATIAGTAVAIAGSIFAAVVAAVYAPSSLGNPLVVAGLFALFVLTATSLALTLKFINRRMPYIKLIRLVHFALLTTLVVTVPAIVSSVQPLTPEWEFHYKVLMFLAISGIILIASTEAPNWVYLLRKSRSK